MKKINILFVSVFLSMFGCGGKTVGIGGDWEYTCNVNLLDSTTDCTGAVIELFDSLANEKGLFQVDLTNYTQLCVVVSICDPTGWTLNIGNSPGNNGGGGDYHERSNDSELEILDTTLTVYGNQPSESQRLLQDPSFVPATGCCERKFFISDGNLSIAEPKHQIDSPFVFRINQPDPEGEPDALLYVAFNRTVGMEQRDGTGTQYAKISLR
ncbi:MAG: hypothetical protein V1754_11665 [Pseudomonadota bacterium]